MIAKKRKPPIVGGRMIMSEFTSVDFKSDVIVKRVAYRSNWFL